jgi:ribokinase
MPSLLHPRRRSAGSPPRSGTRDRRGSQRRPSIICIGDLMLDVVLAPSAPLVPGTDVPGRVALRQGGSAANTARWLARLGARSTLVTAVGRDAAGRALVGALRGDGVVVRATRAAGARTGRIGVVVAGGGERSFVTDRGAADLLTPADVRSGWFDRADALHLPAYSLLGEPLGAAARRALELARGAGAIVSLDLASVRPLLAAGRDGAQAIVGEAAPDILFATAGEAEAILAGGPVEGLLGLAPVAIVKRGAKGATVLARAEPGGPPLRLEIATRSVAVADTTGAGDAFDAGFLVAWLEARSTGRSTTAGLQQATAAGHRAATRQLTRTPEELALG